MKRASTTVAIAGLFATLGLVSCGHNGHSDTFWNLPRLEGSEVEHYETLEEMAKASDVVALGSFIGVSGIRTIQGDAPEDQVFMGQLTFLVEKTNSSAEPSSTLTVEFLMPTVTMDDADHLLGHLNDEMPEAEILLFARAKGGDEAGLYRAVNSLGVWRNSDGGLDAPLSLDDSPDESRLVRSVDQTSIQDLLEVL